MVMKFVSTKFSLEQFNDKFKKGFIMSQFSNINNSDDFLEKVKKAYESNKIEINGNSYGFNKVNFKTATKFASFAEKLDGVAWIGSDEFHEIIKPILLANITYKDMKLEKHVSLIDSDNFMRDSLFLFSIAIVVFAYPLLCGSK